MKHPLAVAVQNGFTAAIAAEIENGNISLSTAKQLSAFAISIAREYLKGNRIFSKRLQDFAADGESWETLLTHDKVSIKKLENDR